MDETYESPTIETYGAVTEFTLGDSQYGNTEL